MNTFRVLKYGTGHPVPKDAKYLSTQTETATATGTKPNGDTVATKQNILVWHYFLVECDSEGTPIA